MKKFLKKNKVNIIVTIMASLLAVVLIKGIKDHNIVPDHPHFIDDKVSEKRSDFEKIKILERTLQKDPKNIPVMIELSDLFIKADDINSAKKILKKILEIDPSNNEAIERLKKLE